MGNKNNNQTEERTMTKYERKVQKRNAEALKEKKRKMAVRGTAIAVVAVCVVLALFLIISNVGKSISYIKVDNESISKSEFNFYYMRTVNYYGSMYASYGMIDSSVSLDEQPYSDTMSWKDYFEKMAVDEIVRVKALVKEAEKNDFKGELDTVYEENVKTLAEDAKTNGKSETEYYEEMFGDSKADVEEYMKEYLLAELWYNKISEDKAVTDEEAEAYYEENKADYDCVDYYVSAVTPEGIDIDTCTEEEYNAAMLAVRAEAELQAEDIGSYATLEEYAVKSDVSDALGEWLFDEARVEGEVAVVDDNDNSTIYAVKFLKRYKDERPTVDIRAMITTAEDADAEAILEEYTSGEQTEDSFIELVNKYTEDTSVTDGLYEGVTRVGMDVEELTEWMFDENRKEGDTKAVTAENGYKYVIYYKGENDPDYKFSIKDSLLTERMDEYVTGLQEVIEVADPNGVLKFMEAAGE